MRPPMLAVVSSLCLSTMPSWAAEAPRVLPPTSPWKVDYADDSCALRRTFGTGDQEVVWELRQFQPGNFVDLTVVSKGIRANQTGKFRAGFEPGEAVERGARFVTYANDLSGVTYATSLMTSEGKRGDSLTLDVSEVERDTRERTITGYTVTKGFAVPFTLRTGELHAPMAAMRTCLDELLTHWGIDAEAQKRITRPVKGLGQAMWASKIQESYPSEALRKEQNGLVRVRMIVDTVGKPSSCHIQMKAKDDVFERVTCQKLMRYAKFEPALDASGQPIESYFITTVIYMVK